jgi:inhibitor of KinA sporulation pathway (predicted exonuclease)
MAKRLDSLIIVDLEATCWEPKSSRPAEEVSEIIEIGVLRMSLKDTWALSEAHSLVVKPRRSHVSTFCETLTGWTQERLEREGQPYAVVIDQLRKLYPHLEDHTWASWGDYDRTMLASCAVLNEYALPEAEAHKVIDRRVQHPGLSAGDYRHPLYPFSRTHLNLKTLFAVAHNLTKEVSVGEALAHQGLTFEGRPHVGVDDARNIARLAQGLFGRLQVSP